jgi:hypothetical protein
MGTLPRVGCRVTCDFGLWRRREEVASIYVQAAEVDVAWPPAARLRTIQPSLDRLRASGCCCVNLAASKRKDAENDLASMDQSVESPMYCHPAVESRTHT